MSDNKIPANIISKFEKQQFKPGDAVCFTWFNVKRYGYVTSTKQVNWGIQYTVKLDTMSYPCGMQIDQWKTKYRTGLIQYTETKQLGSEQVSELAERSTPMYETISYKSDQRTDSHTTIGVGTNIDQRDGNQTKTKKRKITKNNRILQYDDADNNTKISSNGSKRNSNQDVTEFSSDRMLTNDKKSGKRTKKVISDTLEQAIQKQRDFLSGFTKKD